MEVTEVVITMEVTEVEIFRSRISRIFVPDGWIIEYRLTAGYWYGCDLVQCAVNLFFSG